MAAEKEDDSIAIASYAYYDESKNEYYPPQLNEILTYNYNIDKEILYPDFDFKKLGYNTNPNYKINIDKILRELRIIFPREELKKKYDTEFLSLHKYINIQEYINLKNSYEERDTKAFFEGRKDLSGFKCGICCYKDCNKEAKYSNFKSIIEQNTIIKQAKCLCDKHIVECDKIIKLYQPYKETNEKSNHLISFLEPPNIIYIKIYIKTIVVSIESIDNIDDKEKIEEIINKLKAIYELLNIGYSLLEELKGRITHRKFCYSKPECIEDYRHNKRILTLIILCKRFINVLSGINFALVRLRLKILQPKKVSQHIPPIASPMAFPSSSVHSHDKSIKKVSQPSAPTASKSSKPSEDYPSKFRSKRKSTRRSKRKSTRKTTRKSARKTRKRKSTRRSKRKSTRKTRKRKTKSARKTRKRKL